jgi:hypothetical protein
MSDAKTVTVKLSTPVTYGDKTYASLTFRKMKAKDLVAAEIGGKSGDAGRTMGMLASMADVPIPVITELDIDDFNALSATVAPLMGKSAAAAIAKAPDAAA